MAPVLASKIAGHVRRSLRLSERSTPARGLSTGRCSTISCGEPAQTSPLPAPACASAEDIACEGPCLRFEGGTPKRGVVPRVGGFPLSAPVCATSSEDIADEGPGLVLNLPVSVWAKSCRSPLQAGLDLPGKLYLDSEASTECGDSRPSTRSSSPAPSEDACSQSEVARSRPSALSSPSAPIVEETSLLSDSDLDALDAMLRGHQQRDATKSKPVSVERLQGVSLANVCGKLSVEDWATHHVLRENPQASELAFSPTASSRASGISDGTQFRRSDFRMQLPQDVPKAITALVGVPESTRVTQVYRLSVMESEVVLVQQTTSHDVMYGDNFRVQETFSWRPAADGGVEQYTWSEVAWTKSLPWTHGAIKSFIDKSTKKEAKELAATLAEILAR